MTDVKALLLAAVQQDLGGRFAVTNSGIDTGGALRSWARAVYVAPDDTAYVVNITVEPAAAETPTRVPMIGPYSGA